MREAQQTLSTLSLFQNLSFGTGSHCKTLTRRPARRNLTSKPAGYTSYALRGIPRTPCEVYLVRHARYTSYALRGSCSKTEVLEQLPLRRRKQ